LMQTLRYGLHDWRTIVKLGLGFVPHRAFIMLQKIYQNLRGLGSRICRSTRTPLTRD
jgi:hypothetical protein